MSLLLIKLHNGTEIIGNVTGMTDQELQIIDPLQINYKYLSFQPMPAVSVSRYMPFSETTEFTLDLSFIMHIAPPKQSLIAYYTYALKNYEDNIDPLVDKELHSVSNEGSTELDDFYSKILERAENDGHLN